MFDTLEIHNTAKSTNTDFKPSPGVDKVLGVNGHDWQLEVLGLFKDSRFSQLVAPCGSGKSTALVGLAIQDILASKYRRLQLFVVPQRHISGTFFKKDGDVLRLQINEEVYSVSVNPDHDFCETSSVKGLRNLLLTDRATLAESCIGNTLSGLFAMTTNRALALAWDGLTATERDTAIHNLHLRYDESHHISMEDGDSNKLGQICNYVLEHTDETSRMTFATATNFRGDLRAICNPKFEPLFTTFSVDWLTHWASLGIEKLSIGFTAFEEDPIAQLTKNIVMDKSQYHLVILPPCNVGWRHNYEKLEGIDAVVSSILEAWPEARVLDLASPQTQEANKGLLLAEPKTAADGEPQFDVILTCGIGKEGTDWCPCSRLHVTHPEGSINAGVQTLGRLLRRFTGKTTAVARYYYKDFKPRNGKTKQDVLEDRKNALLLMTQCQEMFEPIVLTGIPLPPSYRTVEGEPQVSELASALGLTKYLALKKGFLDCAADSGVNAFDYSNDDFPDEISAVINSCIAEYGVPEELKTIAIMTLEILWLRCADPPIFRGVDAAFVREHGFKSLVKQVSPFGSTLIGHHDIAKMQELVKAAKTSFDENVALVQHFISIGELATPKDWNKYPKLKSWAIKHSGGGQ